MEYSTEVIDTWQISYNDVERVQIREDLNQEIIDRIIGDNFLSNEIVERDSRQYQLTTDGSVRIPHTVYVSSNAYFSGSVYKGFETKTLESTYLRRGDTPHLLYTTNSINGVAATNDVYIDGDLYIYVDCYDGYDTSVIPITANEALFQYTTDGSYMTSNLIVDGDVYVRGSVYIGDHLAPATIAKEYPSYMWGSSNLTLGAVKNEHLDLSAPSIKLGVATYTPHYTLDVQGTINGHELYENDVSLSNIYRKIADSNIDASQIVSGFLDATRIQDASISNVKIVDLDAGKLFGVLNPNLFANNSISGDKIINIDANKITNLSGTINAASGWISNVGVIYTNVLTDKVAIGLTTPTEMLEVAGNVKATSFIGNLATTNLTGTITNAQLATDAVTTTKIQNLAVTDEKIASMSTSKLTGTIDANTLTGTIDVARIADLSITNSKINDVDYSKVTNLGGYINTASGWGNIFTTTYTTTNNNVAIGKNTADEKLDVVGSIKCTGSFKGDGSTLTLLNADNITSGFLSIDLFKEAALPGGKLVAGSISSTQLGTDCVTTIKIQDLAVTNSKLEGNITEDKLVSMPTTKLTGTITNAQLSGGITNDKITSVDYSKIANVNVTNAQLAGGITNDKITSVDYSKIANVNVTNVQLAGGITNDKITSVDYSKIANVNVTNVQLAGGITNDKINDMDANKLTGILDVARIANGSIMDEKLATGINGSKISEGTIEATQLGTDAVTTTKIQNLAVTNDKINDVDVSKITNLSTNISTTAGWTKTTAKVYLSTSTDSVGIGTDTPAARLDINPELTDDDVFICRTQSTSIRVKNNGDCFIQ